MPVCPFLQALQVAPTVYDQDFLQCRDSGVEFLSVSTAFLNIVLAGLCPAVIAPFFFGCRQLAFNKKDGGVRPIAIEMTQRRLVST